MNAQDYHFLLSERATLNKLINQVSPSDVIGRMSLQARLKEVEEGINAYEGATQQLGEDRPTFQGRHVDYGSDFAVPMSLPAQRKDKFTMQLSKPIEKPGFFWLPKEPRNQLPGVLRISESGEARLEVFCLSDPIQFLISEDQNPNRIVGIIGNELITLDECTYGDKSLQGSILISTIYAKRALIGFNYDDEEKITFSKIEFSVEGLDEWLPIFDLQGRYNSKDASIHGISIHYSPPKEISLDLPDGIRLKFIFLSNTYHDRTKISINQKAYISLISEELQPIECFLELVSKVHNFLRFAIDETVLIDSIIGYSNEITQELEEVKNYEVPIEIYYQSTLNSEERLEIHRPDMLFCYKDVADQIEEILTKWLKNYDIYEPTFNLYFASVSSGQKYLEWKFLSLAQGIETLHRRSSQEKEMSEGEFIKIKKNVLEIIPDEKQEWLETRLKYANELSLRKRIKKMMQPFKDLFGNGRERNSFISKVVDTRNYLTHYDSGLKAKAASRESLWKLCMKLEALFQLHFLRLIGMNIESIKSIVNKNSSLRDKLGLEYQKSSRESA